MMPDQPPIAPFARGRSTMVDGRFTHDPAGKSEKSDFPLEITHFRVAI